jgi:hypothetical protein
VTIELDNQAPDQPAVAGPTTGLRDSLYQYSFTATDPDGDSITWFIEWGDDSVETWIGPYASGEPVELEHAWESIDVYPIRAMVRDVHDVESVWSDTLFMDISYVCGDADASGSADIDDIVYIVAFIFSGGPPPDPYESGDADCSGIVDIDDAVYLINYVFSGGPDPCDPNDDGVPDC